MFERFTEDAIRAIDRARSEARRLEFAQVLPEHLLLGLLGEQRAMAAKVLATLGIDWRQLRHRVESRLGRGYMITTLDGVSFAAPTAKVVERALHVADHQGFKAVDSAFLLYALAIESTGDWRVFLAGHGLTGTRIEDAMGSISQGPPMTGGDEALPERFHPRLLTGRAGKALEIARDETLKAGHSSIGTEQILLALTQLPDALGGWILDHNGLDEPGLRVEIHSLIGQGSGTIADLLGYTHVAERSLDSAWQEAKALGHRRVGTGHLALGLILSADGTVSHLFQHLDLDAEQLRWELVQALKASPDDPEPPPGVIDTALVLDPLHPNLDDDLPPEDAIGPDGQWIA